jgi:hypothetical protein
MVLVRQRLLQRLPTRIALHGQKERLSKKRGPSRLPTYYPKMAYTAVPFWHTDVASASATTRRLPQAVLQAGNNR